MNSEMPCPASIMRNATAGRRNRPVVKNKTLMNSNDRIIKCTGFVLRFFFLMVKRSDNSENGNIIPKERYWRGTMSREYFIEKK